MAEGVWFKEAADAMAADATAERVAYTAKEHEVVSRIRIQPAAGLTANATDFASVIVTRRDANGANSAVVATLATTVLGTNSWVAFDDVVAASLANTSLTPGQKLTVQITKSGAGVVVPVSSVHIDTQKAA
jgi:hypothetical protein